MQLDPQTAPPRFSLHSAREHDLGGSNQIAGFRLSTETPTSQALSPLRMLASDNYAWVYLLREKAWYVIITRGSIFGEGLVILSCDACRDCHKASSCGAVTYIDDRSHTY